MEWDLEKKEIKGRVKIGLKFLRFKLGQFPKRGKGKRDSAGSLVLAFFLLFFFFLLISISCFFNTWRENVIRTRTPNSVRSAFTILPL